MKFMPERLIQIREKLGISKAQAAKQLNMSAMGYGRYERGEREPSFQTISFIANTFETTTDYLYGISDNPNCDSITISADEDPERAGSVHNGADIRSGRSLLFSGWFLLER